MLETLPLYLRSAEGDRLLSFPSPNSHQTNLCIRTSPHLTQVDTTPLNYQRLVSTYLHCTKQVKHIYHYSISENVAESRRQANLIKKQLRENQQKVEEAKDDSINCESEKLQSKFDQAAANAIEICTSDGLHRMQHNISADKSHAARHRFSSEALCYAAIRAVTGRSHFHEEILPTAIIRRVTVSTIGVYASTRPSPRT